MTEKLKKLRNILAKTDKAILAFSGGVDSALLLKIAHDVMRDRVIAVTSESPIHPSIDLEDAKKVAANIGVKHLIVRTREMSKEDFLENPPHRCYICKKTIFSAIQQMASTQGIYVILDGSNADDDNDYRPGIQALEELDVRSPLKEAGFTKTEIRQLSQRLNLHTWNKPAMACLASRIPYGDRITVEKLKRIDKAETYLREQGFKEVRVRDHEGLARIEVNPDRIPLLVKTSTLEPIAETLKSLGYQYVTVDIQGYRTGSLNEVIDQ